LTACTSLTTVRDMDPASIQQVRSFNRAVAARVGVFGDRFLGRDRPYGESRTLWEIGADGIEVRALRARLGLDSGYISRVLRSLERQGLIAVEPSPQDGRVRRARLTGAGLAERAELDRRSDEVALGFLAPLSAGQRGRLIAAMAEVERLLTASQVTIAVEDPTIPDAWWCVEQYLAELNARFETGFDASRSTSAEAHELTPPHGALLVARLHARPVGCGALKFQGSGPALLKRMWVAPEARGLGLGRRLLDHLEAYAREAGARVIHLETNRTLIEAIALYRSSGYVEIAAFNDEPYAHHWFEKILASPAP
jgi:DNA-binding MarR family transcriptional regulator/GNAT superfamily N-acetyltransferase